MKRDLIMPAVFRGCVAFLIGGMMISFAVRPLLDHVSPGPRSWEDLTIVVTTWAVSLLLGLLEGLMTYRRRARALVDSQDSPRCSQCGYSLKGLTKARCPECGTPFQEKV